MKHPTTARVPDRFQIYLNDHRGLVAAERSLAERSLEANDGALGQLLEAIVDQIRADQIVLDRVLGRVGGTPNPAKTFFAKVGERFGRLKLNGQLTGYSPLSRVIEIEALLASTAVRHAMWQAVASMAIADDVTTDAGARADAALDHHNRLGGHHLTATDSAFAEIA